LLFPRRTDDNSRRKTSSPVIVAFPHEAKMATSVAAGQTYGHYLLLERIGEGAMGVVYRARDQVLERDVALKFLPPGLVHDESTRKRFRKEALTLARLNHPNIETLYGFETEGGVDFLVMEYVAGVTLHTRLAGGPLRQSEMLEIGVQLASALDEAHKQGVIHRDLKPANVALTPSQQVKVLDFGLARLLADPAQSATESAADSNMAGTLPYLAPEQLRGAQPDQRSDIYALGVVFYEMVTGRRPHAPSSMAALVEAILHEEPAPLRGANREIAPELETIIRKALDKDPRLRYQSAGELKIDLQRLMSGRNLEHIGVSRRPPRRTGLWVAAAACIALAAALLLAPVLRQWRAGRAAPRAPRVVAVLPFEAIGGNPENQALCRGLTDLVTARMVQASKRLAVEVVPASEVRAQGVTSAEDARRKLGVNLVVEGSWDFAGNNQVMYSLVDVQSRRNLDAAVVAANLRNLQATEREVVDRLLNMLNVEFRPESPEPPPARPDAYQYYVRGRGYLLEYTNPQNVRDAIALFKTAVDTDPKFALAYAGLGEAYWRQFQESKDEAAFPKALEACNKAAQLNDQLAPVHVTLGLIYQSRGKDQDAVKEFRRALELDSTSDAAYVGLATSYASLGRNQEAEDAYRRAIELHKDYWGGYSALGAFLAKQGRYDEAAAQFKRVVELAPENVRGYTNLGAIYYLQGKYPEAQQLYEKSLTIQPNYRAYSNLGTLYFYQGRYADSARMFEQALKLNDKDSRMWVYAAAAYYWAGERGQAMRDYEHAAQLIENELKINPRDPKLLVELADCYAMLGKRPKAQEYLRRVVAREASDSGIMFDLAQVYEELGDRGAALDWLAKAIRAGYPPSEVQRSRSLEQLRNDPRYKQIIEAAAAAKAPG
jgi:tetratricopeptide (TPR) repeat protein